MFTIFRCISGWPVVSVVRRKVVRFFVYEMINQSVKLISEYDRTSAGMKPIGIISLTDKNTVVFHVSFRQLVVLVKFFSVLCLVCHITADSVFSVDYSLPWH